MKIFNIYFHWKIRIKVCWNMVVKRELIDCQRRCTIPRNVECISDALFAVVCIVSFVYDPNKVDFIKGYHDVSKQELLFLMMILSS